MTCWLLADAASASAVIALFCEGCRNNDQAHDKEQRNDTNASEEKLIAQDRLSKFVNPAGRPRRNGFTGQIALHVQRQPMGRGISSRAVLLQCLHRDPIQVAANIANQLCRIGSLMLRDTRQICSHQRFQPRRGTNRFFGGDNAANLIESRLQQLFRIKRCCPGQQLVEKHAQAVNVRPGINVHAGQHRLGLGEQAQALDAEPLERVRRGARLVGAAAQHVGAGLLDDPPGREQLVARLDRARAGDQAEVVAADLRAADVEDRRFAVLLP